MKKVISILVVVSLIMAVFTACSKKIAAQKTEEELRAEVKAELEREKKQEESKKQEQSDFFDNNKPKGNDDIDNHEALFQFVKDQFRYTNYEEFDNKVVISNLDVTGDGNKEAILVDQGSQVVPIVFVTLDHGHYKKLPSDLHSGRYSGEVELDSGFVLLKNTYGGPGEHTKTLTIGYYTGSEIKGLEQFDLNYRVAVPGVPGNHWKGDSAIKFIDGYKEFEYHYNLYEDGVHTQDIRKYYKFDSEKKEFIVKELPGGFDHSKDNAAGDRTDDANIQQENPSNDLKNDGTVEEDSYKYSVDTEYLIDLNKDGQQDTIVYFNNQDQAYITINGKKYQFDNVIFELIYNKFRVEDIDTGDHFVEIVLRETEPPNAKRLVFYRYDGKNFYSIGSVTIENHFNREKNEMIVDGSGQFAVAAYSNIMDDGIYYKKYRLDTAGNIAETPQKGIYTYIAPIKSKVNKEIRGYNGKTTGQGYVKIAPGEEIIIYGEVDNWLKINWKDKELWITDEELTHFSPDPGVDFEFDGIRFWS